MTVVPALFFGLLEFGLGVLGYGYPTRFFVGVEGRGAYTTNQKFGWQFFPPAISRLPVACELPADRRPETYRIFVLGGSAAMGTPDPAFGFVRILEAMLREQYSGVKFEVVNAAMTAINSHVVLPIAGDCAEMGGDLFIVYLGNNEVVGPYGPGTVFKGYSPSLTAIRAGIWAKSTKAGQLLDSLIQRLAGRDRAQAEWKGMEMFLNHRVPADDPRLEKVYGHFRRNLTDICDVVRRSGAEVLICTVATNLKDSAPFASIHRTGFSETDQARWEDVYSAGIGLEEAGRYASAVEKYLEAASFDGRFADLHFRLGRCYQALGEFDRAREHFVQARDLDALRFRADTEITGIIRQVAGGKEDRGIYLVDVERVFERSDLALHGIPGEELFYEHVHMNFDGNYLFAQAVFQKLKAILPEWVQDRASDPAVPLSRDRCAELVGLTGWDRFRMFATISMTMDRPPFTHQLDSTQRRALRHRQLEELRMDDTSPAVLVEANRRAVQVHPENVAARLGLGEVLQRQADFAGAAEQYGRVLEVDPGHSRAHYGLGLALAKQGKPAEAVGHYREALCLTPDWPAVLNDLAWILATHRTPELRNGEEAILLAKRACGQTAYRSPVFLNTLAAAHAEAGRFEDAVRIAAKARDLALAQGADEWVRKIRGCLELYRAAKPFRELE